MEIQDNFSLRQYNSFGLDARVAHFARFSEVEQLDELLSFAHHAQKHMLVLGGGSNILLTGNLDKLVLKNEIAGIHRISEDEDHVYVKVGAGENWHGFVVYCIDHDLAGIENLSLIPGNVGAGPMQNIGAYGVELKDVFYELEAFDTHKRELVLFNHSDCRFGYRESVFKNELKEQYIITRVTFRLSKKPNYNTSYGAIETELSRMQVSEKSIRAISQAIIHIRSSKLPDPAVIGNAGSFFKNPEILQGNFDRLKLEYSNIVGYPNQNGWVKLAAGWLIEQCGWKGFRRGDAGCHAQQALVLVNYGNATGDEIYKLSEEILFSVEKKFGIKLQREVNVE